MAGPSIALLAIPVYQVLVYWPFFSSVRQLNRADPRLYDNANPRAAATRARYEAALGAAGFQRWERCRAAHAQGLENLPVFVATMLAGLYAGLPPRTMDAVAVWLVALRAAYNVLYMRTVSRRRSWWRTATFGAQVVTCTAVLVAAAFRFEG